MDMLGDKHIQDCGIETLVFLFLPAWKSVQTECFVVGAQEAVEGTPSGKRFVYQHLASYTCFSPGLRHA